MAATRLTFDILLPNLWSVNELRVARDLLAGPGCRTKVHRSSRRSSHGAAGLVQHLKSKIDST